VWGAIASLGALVTVLAAVSRWNPAAPPPSTTPTRLWVLYDEPDDLALLAGEGGRDLSNGSSLAVEHILVENPPRDIPPELPLPVWPMPRPALVIHSPRAWGFVHPLQDRTLGQRVARDWPALLRTVVPPEKNFVRAGGFDGDCLAANHAGNLWRLGGTAGSKPTRQITLDRPPDRPTNPALLLTNLDPAADADLLGCYQPLASAASPGAVLVLRYRARARQGHGSLAVCASFPVAIPDREAGRVANRIRSLGSLLPSGPDDPQPNRWLYWIPAWVTPADDWQTYVVVQESPPYPTRVVHRNLVIDIAAAGQVWVDDVELFVWQPGGQP
jgi:hypothetical protein